MWTWVIGIAWGAEPPDMGLRRWSMADGLPQSTVNDVVQTSDGRLLFATFGGLVRFDGVTFETWDGSALPLPSIRATSVAEAADGAWVVGTQEGWLFRVRDREVELLSPSRPLGEVWDLAVRGDTLWVASAAGVASVEGADWTWHSDLEARTVVPWGPRAAFVDTAGLHVVDPQGRVDTWLAENGLHDVALDRDRLWVAGARGTLLVTSEGAQVTHPRPARRVAARDGVVWVGAGGDLWRGDGAERVVREEGSVRSLVLDREGNLWVGWVGRGLARLEPRPFRDRPTGAVGAILRDPSGGGWLARCDGESRSLVRVRAGVEEGVDLPDPESDCARALQWVDGELWVGIGQEVHARAADGGWRLLGTFPSYVLAVSPDGRWVGTRDGLWNRVDRDWQPVEGFAGPVSALVEAGGDLWVAHGAGASRRREATWRHWTVADGLPRVAVRDVLPTRYGDAWLGTYGGGLVRVGAGPAVRVTTEHGLPENVVSRLLQGPDDGVWLLGNRGVTRVARAELEAFAAGDAVDVRARLWFSGEGNGGAQPAGDLVDGELWFPTVEGRVEFVPEAVAVNRVPPRLVVRHATVDGVPLRADDVVSVPPGPGRVELAFTAGALHEPTLARFAYRLDGGPWQDLGSHRRVSWEGVRGGRHTIELSVANEDGVPAEAPVRFTFDLAVPWWERPWVQLLAALAALWAAWALHRSRTRFVEEQNAALQREVTHRERAEVALRKSEAHYREIFQLAGDGLLLVGADGRIRDANPAAMVLFGSARLVGEPLDRFVVGRAEGLGPCVKASGTRFDAQVVSLLNEQGGRIVSVRDVEPLRRAAESERMEAVGRLAGGVAHDLNNLLTVLSGVGTVLREEVDRVGGSELVDELVDDLDACVVRGGTLTRELMAFGRRQVLRPEPVAVDTYLQRLRPRLERAGPDGIQVTLEPVEARLTLLADPTQLELALLNLVINGAHAMPDGGIVILRAWSVGEEVVVEVEDTGEGIAPELIPHIYEPFFSTRPGGSGLGLASVHGFVVQSGGRVEVRSRPGKGTTFRLFLPRADPADAPLPARPLEGRRGRVLVVDDDPAVLGSIVRMLEQAGFEVESRSDPEEAVHLDPRRFDVVVSDVLMPKLRGPELVARLRRSRPDLPVLFVSGFVDDAALGGERFLPKPFAAQALVAAVTEAMG